MKSDRVNLVAPASPVQRARYSTNWDRKREKLTRLGNSKVRLKIISVTSWWQRHWDTWGGGLSGGRLPLPLVTPMFVLYMPTILYMQCIQNIELRKLLLTLDWELRKWKLLSFKFKYLELSQGVIGNISLSKELSFCHKLKFSNLYIFAT